MAAAAAGSSSTSSPPTADGNNSSTSESRETSSPQLASASPPQLALVTTEMHREFRDALTDSQLALALRGELMFAHLFRCTFTNPIGQGRFSRVYRCESIFEDSLPRAVKVTDTNLLTDAARTVLRREAEIQMRTSHMNIVMAVCVFHEPSRDLLVTDLLSGGELYREIVRRSCYGEHDAK